MKYGFMKFAFKSDCLAQLVVANEWWNWYEKFRIEIPLLHSRLSELQLRDLFDRHKGLNCLEILEG